MNNSDIALKCSGLLKNYHEKSTEIQVINNLSLTIKKGERIAIVGSSGSGKTTLLNLLAGIDTPDSGEVFIDGEALYSLNEQKQSKFRNEKFGFVYQFHHLLPEFNAVENVAMPLFLRKEMQIHTAELQAKEVLEKVGLSERLRHKPSQLSGGERQRVAIARAIVGKPTLVFMDEPTGNLDHHTATDIHDLMLLLSEEHAISFVVVTHDLKLAEKIGTVYKLIDGQLQEGL